MYMRIIILPFKIFPLTWSTCMYPTLLTLQFLTDQSLPLGFLRVEEEIMTPSFFSSWELMLDLRVLVLRASYVQIPCWAQDWLPISYLEKQTDQSQRHRLWSPNTCFSSSATACWLCDTGPFTRCLFLDLFHCHLSWPVIPMKLYWKGPEDSICNDG